MEGGGKSRRKRVLNVLRMDVVSLGKDSKVNQFDPRAGGARSMIIDDHRQRCGRRGSGEGQRGGRGVCVDGGVSGIG